MRKKWLFLFAPFVHVTSAVVRKSIHTLLALAAKRVSWPDGFVSHCLGGSESILCFQFRPHIARSPRCMGLS